MTLFAEVSVNSPTGQRKAFSYSVPVGLVLRAGQAVWVPFGDKTLQGIVLELNPTPQFEETREIVGVIQDDPLLSPAHLSLARWISDYYLTPLFEAVALMLPPGFERRIETFFSVSAESSGPSPESSQEDQQVWAQVRERGTVKRKDLESVFPRQTLDRVLSRLLRRGLLNRLYRLESPRVAPKTASFITLRADEKQIQETLGRLGAKAPRQTALLHFLSENRRPVTLREARAASGASQAALRGLLEKGLVEIRDMRVERDPLADQRVNLSFPLPLTPDQQSVFQAVAAHLSRRGEGGTGADRIFLLRGVTGSGKTEIYLHLLAQAVSLGKKGIVLVPEISMTPQIIERFVSRFPGRVAVLHSGLSLGERFDEWWRVKRGQFDVVIGPRSAIFSPQPDLGLIIMDEEHEWSYKQQDSPRYHAREVALRLAGLNGATVVLGSATPDVESNYRALQGQYSLLELNERVSSGDAGRLPAVEVIDMREELKAGNLSIFSRALNAALVQTLKNHEQAILFLNRRGSASFVECRNCGYVVRCKRCQAPLSYHAGQNLLICHRCNYRVQTPQICPRCRSRKIKYLGLGTEGLERETSLAFPSARLLRWDSDVVRGSARQHRSIFENFSERKSDILIGTQMIAKGLDLRGVTLVGVVNADITLNLPDFRSYERTFQLLSQVAGRAGRGAVPGRVVIQTYAPENYAIQAAARHDYPGFYNREIEYRRELRNPPFSRLVTLVFAHTNLERCRQEAESLKKRLEDLMREKGIAGLELIGPAPTYIERLRGRYRWQLILRGSDPAAFLSPVVLGRGWSVDIDPLGLS